MLVVWVEQSLCCFHWRSNCSLCFFLWNSKSHVPSNRVGLKRVLNSRECLPYHFILSALFLSTKVSVPIHGAWDPDHEKESKTSSLQPCSSAFCITTDWAQNNNYGTGEQSLWLGWNNYNRQNSTNLFQKQSALWRPVWVPFAWLYRYSVLRVTNYFFTN